MKGLQVLNRSKLQRAGKDNLFVKLAYGKDEKVVAAATNEQERLGKISPFCGAVGREHLEIEVRNAMRAHLKFRCIPGFISCCRMSYFELRQRMAGFGLEARMALARGVKG